MDLNKRLNNLPIILIWSFTIIKRAQFSSIFSLKQSSIQLYNYRVISLILSLISRDIKRLKSKNQFDREK